jgi:hypothetical protein
VRFSLRSRALFAPLATVCTVMAAAGLTGQAAFAAPPHYGYAPSVQLGYTDSARPNQAYDANGVNFPLGSSVEGGGTVHTSRIYATYDIDQFIGKHFISASLNVQEASATDCTKRAIEVWSTKAVDSTPTWKSAPRELVKQDDALTPEYCPASLSFNVSNAISTALAHSQSRVTFELRVPGQYETDPSYGRTLSAYHGVILDMQYNSVPSIDNTTLAAAGRGCGTKGKPVQADNSLAPLQAVANDADTDHTQGSNDELTVDFAVWPVSDSGAVTTVSKPDAESGWYTTANVPSGVLVSATTYGWRVQATDGMDTTAWSKTCYFTYDTVRPSAPTITSTNYPPSGSSTPAPLGVPGTFVISGVGDPDAAGFEYSWGDLGIGGACEVHAYAQVICPDPFSVAGTVKFTQPGGSATLKLSPPDGFYDTLSVRTIDLAGNRSTTTTYTVFVPYSAPVVTVVGDTPQWNRPVTLKFAPQPGVKHVTDYAYQMNYGDTQTVQAAADGTASATFVASDPDGYSLTVTSHSMNGFVSDQAHYSIYFDPGPGVTSDVYLSDGDPHGGVGVPGTFTLSPPPGWFSAQEYQYLLPDASDWLTVPAGADGTATITWTPTASGYADILVRAVSADGQYSDYLNDYSFAVG